MQKTIKKEDLKKKRKKLNLDSEKTIERPVDIEISKEGRVEFEEYDKEKQKKINDGRFGITFGKVDGKVEHQFRPDDIVSTATPKEIAKANRLIQNVSIPSTSVDDFHKRLDKFQKSEEEIEEEKRMKERSERETAILNSPENVGNFSTEIKSREQMMKLAVFLMNNSLVPSSFKQVNEVVMAIQTAMSLGYNKFGSISLAIKNMYIINNSVSLWGELPMAIVNKSGLLERFDEYFLDKNWKKISEENENLDAEKASAVCIIQRKGRNQQSFYLTTEDLKYAGIIQKPDGSFTYGKSVTWSKYPKIHWIRRNRAFALKTVFPDLLSGSEILEYDGLKYASSNDEVRKKDILKGYR